MAGKIANELRAKSDAATTRLMRQIDGLEPHADRSAAPGEWSAREVLSHLLAEPGRDPAGALRKFSEQDFPTVDVEIGKSRMTEDRKTMSLKQFGEALESQRQQVLGYLDGLSDDELHRRKARVPILKAFLGTDETPLHVFAGVLLEGHWGDHTGQLAKIRKAAGLPEAS
jgi:hypothetical protein